MMKNYFLKGIRIVSIMCLLLTANKMFATSVTLDSDPKTATDGVTFDLSGAATVNFGAYSLQTTMGVPNSGNIAISVKIDIAMVYISWATNTQGMTVQFYSGGIFKGSVPYDAIGWKNVNLTNIDQIIINNDGTSNSGAGDLQIIDYTISAACTDPTVPTVTSVTSVCSGNSATLNISGTLNDATQWAIYTGSCGGTLIGTTSTSTFVVTPSGTGTTYYVRGEGGCTTPGSCGTITINVSNPSISATLQTNVSCNGGANGAASVSAATGGIAPYSYNWTPGNPTGDGTTSVTGLTAGTWTCQVTDANSCTASQNFTITQPSALVLTPASQTNISCFGGANGAASVNAATGGVGGYTYNWTPGNPTGDGTISVTGLTAGTWTCQVTDANSCTASQNFTITQPSALVLTPASQTNISCFGGANGAASVNAATGGVGGYTYNWTPGNPTGDGTISVTGLTAGTWTCQVTDANSCTASQNFTITQPTVLSLTPSSQTNVACNGGSNGVATVNVATGGVGGYVYDWTPGNPAGDGTTSVTGLTAGTWTCQVTDANGCTSAVNIDITTDIDLAAPVGDVGFEAGEIKITIVYGDFCLDESTWTLTDASSNIIASGGPYSCVSAGVTAEIVNIINANGPYSFYGETQGSYGDNVMNVTIECDGTMLLSNSISANTNNTFSGIQSCIPGDGTIPAAIGECSVTLAAPTATDNCAGSVTGTTSDPTTYNTIGSYVITWDYDDGAGNISHQTQDVIVNDITPPVAVCKNINVYLDGTGNASIVAADIDGGSTDNCGSVTLSASITTFTCANIGANNVTLTVTDGSSNTANCIAVVTVIDNINPTIVCPGIQTIAPGPGCIAVLPDYTTMSTTADNCGSVTVTQSPIAGTTISAPTTVTLTATDASSNVADCTFDVTIDALTVSVNVDNHISCFGSTDGGATASGIGGTSPYSYAWSGGQSTDVVTSLSAGNHSLTVTDANGCTASSSININEPAVLVANSTGSDILCNGGTTTVTVTATGGTTPYTGIGDNTVSVGTANFTVTDANGCIANTSITINEPLALTASSIGTDVLCNGGTTTVTVSAVGGVTPYTNTGNYSEIAGTYNYTVIDNNGCTSNTLITINEPSALAVSAVITNVKCNGGSDGAFDITVSGGVTPYTFNWDNGSTTEDLVGISAGTYGGTITDANGCTISGSDVVSEPSALVASATGSDILCNGGTTIVTVSALGGVTPYNNTGDYSEIAGTYNYTVTDANGCTSNTTITINEPSELIASSTGSDVLCNGGTTTVTVSAVGGVTPYANTGDYSEIPGTYNYTVIDNNGCTSNTSITINEPSALAVSAIITNVTCNGGSDGAFDITVSGGVTPYTFNWDNGATTEDLSGLTAGTYGGTITDANGCSISGSDVITEPVAMTLSLIITNTSIPAGNDGAVDLTVADGQSPFSFLWDGGQVTEDLTGLVAGTYNVTVTDNCGNSVTGQAIVEDPTYCTTDLYITGCIEGDDIGWFKFNDLENNTMFTSCPGTTGYSDFTNLSTSVAQGGIYNLTIGTSNPNYDQGFGIWIDFNQDADFEDAGEFVWSSPGTNMAPDIFMGQITIPVDALPGTTRLRARGIYNMIPAINQACTNEYYGEVEDYTLNILDCNGLSANVNMITDATCFGGADGSITTTISGGTTPLTYLWSDNSISQDLTSASAGTYSLVVTDAIGCIATTDATISEPLEITVTSVVTDANCGNADGTATLTIINGSSPYTEDWAGNNPMALLAGSYTVTVTDANGCTAQHTVLVNNIGTLDAIVTKTDATCFGSNDGTATVAISGGTSPYSEDWGSANPIALSAGNYSVTITDNIGCEVIRPFIISQPSQINIIASVTHANCNGASDGSASITITGGTSPYVTDWGTADPMALSAGTYIVTVTDANSCTNTKNIIINQPSDINLTFTPTNVNCFGNSNGSIMMTVSGGTPGYLYDWSGPNGYGNVAKDIVGLEAGSYDVTVTDSHGCESIDNVVLTEPSEIMVSSILTNVTCNGGNDGAIDITVSGGTTPYSLNWDNGSTTEDISGLTAGMYNGTITDANGCTLSGGDVITEPAAIDITAAITDVLCYTGNNGAIDVTVTGGTSPYTFSWSNTSITEDLSGLNAGAYDVTVTDNASCTATASFTVNEPATWTITSALTNVSCNGSNDGAIDVTVSGGTSPFTYSWTGGLTTEDISGLTAGLYELTLTDNNNCTNGHVVTITEPDAISVSSIVSNVSCNGGNDGAIDITVTGGITPFTFAWDNSATTEDLSGLAAGSYNGTITDANGCTLTGGDVITEPLQFNSSVVWTDVSCNGGNNGSIDLTLVNGISPFTVLWSNGATTEDVSGLTAGHYTVSITDANGCYTDIYADIAEPTAITVTTTITHENAGSDGAIDIAVSGGTTPYTFLWSGGETTEDITGLVAGIYSVTVTDANGCQKVKPNIVVNNIACTLTASLSGTNLLCNGDNTGTALATAIGGTSPFTYLWSNNETTDAIYNLSAGDYTVSITDNTGCLAIESITITEPVIFDSYTTWTDITCNGANDGSIDLTLTGGTSPFTYIWTNSETTEDIYGLSVGTHSVTATDFNSCVTTNYAIIAEPVALSVSLIATDATCYGLSDGNIDATVSGGTTPYTFDWTNLETTEDLFGVVADSYSLTVTDFNNCETSETVLVNEPSQILNNVTASICDGDSIMLEGAYQYTAGTYTDIHTAANGCDSTVVTELTINPVYATTDAAIICDGDSYVFGTQTLTIAGDYIETFVSELGCDSVVTLTLTVTTAYATTDAAIICEGDSYIFGTQTLTIAGDFTETFVSELGCDSVVILTLTVNPVYATTDAATICEGDSYIFGSQTLTIAGDFTETFASEFGCDSIVTLTLTVNPVYVINQSAEICEGAAYTLPDGTDVTVAGTYNSVFVSEFGCDSTIVTDLIVNPIYNINETVQICTGSDYMLPDGTIVNTDGTYISNLSSVFGCDSTIVTEIVTTSAIINNVFASICEGDSYFAEGTFQTTTGVYYDTTSAVAGCDSIIITDLTVNPVYAATDAAAICDGDSYIFGTQTLTVAGDYTETFASELGCDSVVTLTLTVNPVYVINESAEICEGATYTLPDGTDVTVAGTYNSVFVSEFGCDSTIVTDLIVNPVYNINETVQICSGSDYMLPNGTIVNTDGTYTSNLSTVFGCDSIIVTEIVTTTQIINNVTAMICEGDSIFAEGSWQYATGIFHDTTTAVAGCDSIIITDLTVNPLIMVDLGADDTLCFETADVLTLDAGNAGMSYLWSDGSTAQTFVADAIALGMGTHTIGVTVTDGVCTSTDEIVLTVDICSGIVAVNEQLNISMYPNPTKGMLNIAIEGLNNDATISIMDISGKVIMKETLSAETTMKQVDFSILPKGIYAVKVTSGDVVKVNRVVVQ